MCTVIFIPQKNKKYFASLRDENPLRLQASTPQITEVNNIKILSPIDTLAGGTWIGTNEFNNVIILLNGAYENHQRENYYRKSRGLIVKELLGSKQPVNDWNLINLEQIEPFTLIVFSHNNLHQLVWNGEKKISILLDASAPHIWSSSTLYSNTAKGYRENMFNNWLATNPFISKINLLNFFHSSNDKQNGFIINRSKIMQTLSYSFLEIENNNNAIFNYYNFANNEYTSNTINIKTPFVITKKSHI